MADKITVVVCEPYKKAKVEQIENTLEAMQKLVGGYIETVMVDGCCIVCNDDGKFNGTAPCRMIYGKDGEQLDVIFGKFFICGTDLEAEEFCSLTEAQQEHFLSIFGTPEYFYRDANGKIFPVRKGD